MRIGIDARPFKYKEFSGIPESVYRILQEWMEHHPEHEYDLISNSEICLPCTLPPNWHKVIRPDHSGNGTLWMLFRLPGIIRERSLDVFWGTNYMLPAKVQGCRYVVSVYDLAFVRYPQVSSRKTLLALKLFSKSACKKADFIHTISQSTAKDVEELYRIQPEKIRTVYLGGPESKTQKAVPVSIEIQGRYFLFLSTIEPRKNPVLVLKAYQLFCDRFGDDIQLVFAGKYGWNLEQFDQCLVEHPYRNRIHLLGYISLKEKNRLLAHAEALLYPSLYEGFGLPILEAMSFGTTVVTSRVSSMPEVAGEAALYIENTASDEQLCRRMQDAVTMSESDREQLRRKMEQNLKRFRWSTCADQLMQCMTELVSFS